jgi:hypothetical protein
MPRGADAQALTRAARTPETDNVNRHAFPPFRVQPLTGTVLLGLVIV